ncbi:MAG TPA: hypothetical protein VHR72_06605 [Gemmataceae bacterium]|jgi:hypothetical protein|nr:hypothetical protein [Gemmataceae bacterium]
MRFVFCAGVLLFAQAAEAPLRFEATPTGQRVVARLPGDVAGKLPAGSLTQEQGETLLTLSLLGNDAKTPGPSMIGKYERAGNDLTFTPRFPLDAGATYRAVLTVVGHSTPLDFRTPKLAAKSPPKVVHIFPTADVLPANHLRFYIQFDRPMRGGRELFKHLTLLDDKGKEIEEPWLVDEIWDEATNTLILYIHPGRIKWGVELRDSMGPVLVEKRTYSLVVRGEWTDLDGNKIGKDVVKRFRTTAEDRKRIELGDWKLTAPKAGTRDAVTLTFPKSIDVRSLQSGLAVANARGQAVAGTAAIGPGEKSWSFTPTEPWQPRSLRVNVSPDLEDDAGNTPTHPFDVDLDALPRPAQRLRIDFEPR